jgi:membrane-bound serine protease (ClpP class)
MFGDWNLLKAFLYVMGIVLLLTEALMPGFGVAGISGAILTIVSIVLIASNFYQVMLILVATIALTVLIVVALYKMGYGRRYLKSIILDTEQKNNEGYVSTKDNKKLLGMKGIVVTPLRTAGTILLDGKKIDAVSEGEYIEKDKEVEVIKVEGSRVVVREVL